MSNTANEDLTCDPTAPRTDACGSTAAIRGALRIAEGGGLASLSHQEPPNQLDKSDGFQEHPDNQRLGSLSHQEPPNQLDENDGFQEHPDNQKLGLVEPCKISSKLSCTQNPVADDFTVSQDATASRRRLYTWPLDATNACPYGTDSSCTSKINSDANDSMSDHCDNTVNEPETTKIESIVSDSDESCVSLDAFDVLCAYSSGQLRRPHFSSFGLRVEEEEEEDKEEEEHEQEKEDSQDQ